jgi:hypothetical protein
MGVLVVGITPRVRGCPRRPNNDPQATCHTCVPCNNAPGGSYEKRATNNDHEPELPADIPTPVHPVLGRPRVQQHGVTGLHLLCEDEPLERSIFKSGFLLAFRGAGLHLGLQ